MPRQTIADAQAAVRAEWASMKGGADAPPNMGDVSAHRSRFELQ